MTSPTVISLLIAAGGLAVSIITVVTSYLRSTREESGTRQMIMDAIDSLSDKLVLLTEKVDGLDRKLDDHSVKIVRIETRIDGIEDRIEKIELRCDRHFRDKAV